MSIRGRIKAFLLLLILSVLLLQGCSNEEPEASKAGKETTSAKDLDAAYEKGYDLPLEEAMKTQAMETLQAIAEKLNTNKDSITEPYYEDNTGNMQNYSILEQYLQQCQQGKTAAVTVYKAKPEKGIGQYQFSYNGSDMYLLYTYCTWNEKKELVWNPPTYTRVKDWTYTDKGWFTYELCVPEPPEVTEVVNGYGMIRVKPIQEEYREIAEKYLRPIGYQGTNLLCSDWDKEHMDQLDYNGMYEYLYAIKYQKRFEGDQNTKGIAKEDFERLLMEYLPVTAEQLEKYSVYNPLEKNYAWDQLGCLNYAPNVFGTSFPEITGLEHNKDGTITLTVDAVCDLAGSDCMMSHKLTMKIEGERVQYLGNQILGNGLEEIPEYQNRLQ